MDTKFKKGMTPWNRGTVGVMKPNKTSFKKGHGFVPLATRFWSKAENVHVVGVTACWNWLYFKNNKGYGVINVDGRVTLAHRVAYQLSKGGIPKGAMVCHRCDNPACVNPFHLFLGSPKDNMQDMSRKKRGCNGEKAPWAKLTQEKVNKIRSLYASEGTSMRKLAKQFGVSYVTINFIINNKTWK